LVSKISKNKSPKSSNKKNKAFMLNIKRKSKRPMLPKESIAVLSSMAPE
jgi:hypothetical protein